MEWIPASRHAKCTFSGLSISLPSVFRSLYFSVSFLLEEDRLVFLEEPVTSKVACRYMFGSLVMAPPFLRRLRIRKLLSRCEEPKIDNCDEE